VLGATGSQIRAMVLQEAGWLATAGVVVGLGVAIILMRLVQSMLYGLKPSDPLSLTVSALLLLAVALLAGWTPAVRASRVEPMEALRHEELSNCIQIHSEWATRFRLVCLDITPRSPSTGSAQGHCFSASRLSACGNRNASAHLAGDLRSEH
jgi:predicted lysophospholipase L1 biosynthesis ABC-type transport system permease subunit